MSFASEFNSAVEKFSRAVEKMSETSGGGGAGTLASAMSSRGGSPGGAPPMGSFIGGLSGGKSFLAAAGPAGVALAVGGAVAGAAHDALAAGARFLTPAAQRYAATGSSQSFAAGVTKSIVDAVGSNAIGGFLTADVQEAMKTNQRAGGNVKEVTDDLARIGVQLSDQQLQRMFDAEQKREERVGEMRGRVDTISGSAAEMRDVKPAGAGGNYDRMVAALERIEHNTRAWR